MQSAEIELKFAVTSLAALTARLDALDFHLDTPRTLEQNTLYDTPDRALKGRGELLRLRHYGLRQVVTHKRHPDHEEQGSIYKVRIETEAEVSDAEALAEIFTRLGYGPAFRYEKYRTEYSQPILAPDGTHGSEVMGHLVLDETPIGTWAEIEGPTVWIDTTLRSLGISPADCLTQSYGKLFLEWKRATGSTAENLTFDEIHMPEYATR